MKVSDYDAIITAVTRVVREEMAKAEPPKPEPYDDTVVMQMLQSVTETVERLSEAVAIITKDVSDRAESDNDRIAGVIARLDDFAEEASSKISALGERIDKHRTFVVNKNTEMMAAMGDVSVPTAKDVAGFMMDDMAFIKEVKGEKGDKGETGGPGDVGPPPTQGQVDAAVEKFLPQIRRDLSQAVTDIEHKGVYRPGEEYLPGQEVIKNGSTFRAMEPTSSTPPGDDWQLISQGKAGKRGEPGEPGEKGEVGEKGADAPRIVSGVMNKDMLVLTFDNGEAIEIDIEDIPEGDDE